MTHNTIGRRRNMDKINNLIPKDKFDISTISKIPILTEDEAKPILLNLLE